MVLGCGVLLLAVLLVAVPPALGCIHMYGSTPEGLEHAALFGTPWSYAMAGIDWNGTDSNNVSWVCNRGMKQSPINLEQISALLPLSHSLATTFDVGVITSNGTNVDIINNGHTVQVEWTDPGLMFNVTVGLPAPGQGPLTLLLSNGSASAHEFVRVPLTPLQFHFHTHSEHLVGGMMYPMEAHLVMRTAPGLVPGCPPTGCFAVVGIMFQLGSGPDAAHPFLAQLWDYMPNDDLTSKKLPAGRVLNLSTLLPANRSYITYEGSLTTPPCTEGLLWHVMTQPQTMSYDQLLRFLMATASNVCTANNSSSTANSTASAPHHRLRSLLLAQHLGQLQHVASAHVRRSLLHSASDHGHHHSHDHDEGQHQDHSHAHEHHDLDHDRTEPSHGFDVHAVPDHLQHGHGHGELHHGAPHGHGSMLDLWQQARRMMAADAAAQNVTYVCVKDGVGVNYRMVQAINGRQVWYYVDAGNGTSQGTGGHGTPPASHGGKSASGEAAAFGIIFGILVGVVAVSVLASFIYHRNLKKNGGTAGADAEGDDAGHAHHGAANGGPADSGSKAHGATLEGHDDEEAAHILPKGETSQGH